MKRLFPSIAMLQGQKPAAAATADPKAVADIEKAGGAVRQIAQNDDHLEVSFQLQGAKITDKDLVDLPQLKKVTQLNLGKTSVTDAGLSNVSKLSDLTTLHLEQTKVTDAGLAQLKGLKQLEYLNLYGTAVSDAGLSQLTGLSNLKTLYLWQTKVTPEGAKKLKQALPHLDINLGWEAPTQAKSTPPAK